MYSFFVVVHMATSFLFFFLFFPSFFLICVQVRLSPSWHEYKKQTKQNKNKLKAWRSASCHIMSRYFYHFLLVVLYFLRWSRKKHQGNIYLHLIMHSLKGYILFRGKIRLQIMNIYRKNRTAECSQYHSCEVWTTSSANTCETKSC